MLLSQLRDLGLAMGGSYPAQEFTTDEDGEQVTVTRRLHVGYTTDQTKADAACEAGATVTRCPSATPGYIGWEVSLWEVV